MMMKKNVWILNHYAGQMYFDKGWRHYWIAKFLKQDGYNPVIFCSNSKHGSDGGLFFESETKWLQRNADEISVPFVFVQARSYRNNGKDRILNMIDFYRNVQFACKEYAHKHGKPDIIYASSVHPLTLVAGIKLAKRFNVKCICEVRDLWPESIIEYTSAIKRNSVAAKILYLGEKRIYKKADAVVFTAEGEYNYIIEKGWEDELPKDKFYYINNGVDLEMFENNRKEFEFSDPDLRDQSKFKVVYTGSIRRVNGLGLLLDAAKLVSNPNVHFLIWGDGDELSNLKKRVIEENIHNVTFKGRVDKKFVPSIISQADLNIAHNTPSPLFRFGISFNKLFEYFAAGKPVFSDFPCEYNPAVMNGAGTEVREATPESIARGVEAYTEMGKDQYMNYCRNAVNAAKKYDFKALTQELTKIIENV